MSSLAATFELDQWFACWCDSKKHRKSADKMLVYLEPLFRTLYKVLKAHEGMEWLYLSKLLTYYGDPAELMDSWLPSEEDFVHELRIYAWRVYRRFRRRPRMTAYSLYKSVMTIIRLHLARDIGRHIPRNIKLDSDLICYDKYKLNLEPLFTSPEAYIAVLLMNNLASIEDFETIWPFSRGKVHNLKEAYCQKLSQLLLIN